MFSPCLTNSNILEKTEVQVNIGFHDGVCNLRNVMASEAVFSSLFATLGVSWATLGLKMRRPSTLILGGTNPSGGRAFTLSIGAEENMSGGSKEARAMIRLKLRRKNVDT